MQPVEEKIVAVFSALDGDAIDTMEVIEEMRSVILYLLPFYQMAAGQFVYPDNAPLTTEPNDAYGDDVPLLSDRSRFLGGPR